MSKNIDINNEEEILKECDFDYFYNSENCSRELCAFYNDIFRNGNNENFDKRQALIDLGRIGIVLNNQSQQIAELKAENEELKAYKKGAYEKYVSKCAYLQQQLKEKDERIETLQGFLERTTFRQECTKQVCEKIRKNIVKYVYGGNLFDIKGFKEFLDQVEKGE